MLLAPPQLLAHADGTEQDYQQRFDTENLLGQGEFGQVWLVTEQDNDDDDNDIEPIQFASKALEKGIVFKYNTLYMPCKVRGSFVSVGMNQGTVRSILLFVSQA